MDYFLFNFSGVQFHYTMSQKIKIKKLNTDIFLVETKTHKFIIDEFAEYDNNLGIVVMC